MTPNEQKITDILKELTYTIYSIKIDLEKSNGGNIFDIQKLENSQQDLILRIEKIG